MNTHKVTLMPTGRVVEVNEEKNLFVQLREQEVYINTICGGYGKCGKCVIKIIDGDQNINEPTFEEKQLLGNVFSITRERLACQTFVYGAVTVDLSAHDETKDKKERKNVTTNSSAKLRKRDDVRQMYRERKEASDEKKAQKEQKLKEKEGGFRRPKAFSYVNHDESEE